MAEAREPGRRRVLDPLERFSEALFGVIMALTFTGSLSAATAGREDVRVMVFGAIGCNLAWGIVDGVMHLLNTLGERGRGFVMLTRLRRTRAAEEAHRVVAESMPPVVASALTPAELETMRQRLIRLPEPPARARLRADDYLRALAVMVVVFVSTFPIVLPFFFIQETLRAMRWSNAIALAMLLAGGYQLGRYSGQRPIVTGLAMVGIGIALVLLTIALGG